MPLSLSIFANASLSMMLLFSSMNLVMADSGYSLQSKPYAEIQANDSKAIHDILMRVQQRPLDKTTQPTFKFKPTPRAYLAFSLYLNPNNQTLKQAQRLYYQIKYPNYSTLPERRLCVTAIGRNVAFQHRYKTFLDSINRQHYSNYHIVLVDDASSDGSVSLIRDYLRLNPSFSTQFRQKIDIASNPSRKYALYSKQLAVRDYCREGQIVVQVDTDDSLIGTQAFKVINYHYLDESVWAFYSNYVRWNADYGQPSEGISEKVPQRLLVDSSYRHSMMWVSSATRSYRRELFMKIDSSDFMDEHGEYYGWSSDLFIHFSIIELAGPKHYKFANELFYFYHLSHNSYQSLEKKRCRILSSTLQPYLPLEDLHSPAVKSGKRAPEWIWQQLKEIESQLALTKTNEGNGQ